MSRPLAGRGGSSSRLSPRLSPRFTRGSLRGFTRGSSLGFTLIEVIVVIAVLSILASMAVPLAAKVIDQSRTEATRKQMEEIHKLIVGDPALGTAGYVGDMGRLPQGLAQLNNRIALPWPAQPNGSSPVVFRGVKLGWWGPYINSGFNLQAYQNDAWGTPYAYGNPVAGQFRAAGPDRTMNTADDIIYPPSQVVINGSLVVHPYLWNGTAYAPYQPADCPGMTMSFYYSSNGTQASDPKPAGPPPYTFIRHSGLHAVEATCTAPAATGRAVVLVPGNNQVTSLNLYLR